MPTRFDHAVIVVRDLDDALACFRRLGFDAQLGGKHTGRGTWNALIRFGLDYVELLSVYDEAEARSFRGDGGTLLDVLDGREARLVGYALATVDIAEDARRFKGTGDELPVPNPMQRARPDGQMLTWRTLSAGDNTWDSWGKPWPFLIQWDMPDEQRLKIDRPGFHANGVTAWTNIAIVARDLEPTAEVYQNQLGLTVVDRGDRTDLAARSLTFGLGHATIDVLVPSGDGATQQILSSEGEGPCALRFAVKDLQQTRAFLDQQGIRHTFATDPERLVLDPAETAGVRLCLG